MEYSNTMYSYETFWYESAKIMAKQKSFNVLTLSDDLCLMQ